MRYRKLGNTGLMVSEISYGTIPILKGNSPVLPEYFNLSDDQAIDVLEHAYKLGCNLFDTAIVPEYGDAEIKLGLFLKTIDRRSVVISSKARFFTGNELYNAVLQSNENLGSYCDIYFVHQVDPSNEEMVFRKYGAIDALCELKLQGKIRFVGVASHYFDILKKGAKDDRVDVLQGSGNILECGMLRRIQQDESFRKKGLLINKVFAAGILTSYFSPTQLISGVLSYPVSSIILGLGKTEQIDIAMQSDITPSNIDFDDVISRIKKEFNPIQCDRCQKCKCINNIEIHTTFRQYNYFFLGKDYWAFRKLDMDIKNQASLCKHCTTQVCLETCPKKIDIPTHIQHINKLVSVHVRKGIVF